MNTLSGARLRRNVGLNLAGYVLPFLAAVAGVPILLEALGPDRFGLVSLAWTIAGAMAVFDLGTSRAVTKLVAESFGEADSTRLAEFIGTAGAIGLSLGSLAGVLLAGASPWIWTSLIQVPPDLQADAVRGFRVLALLIPGLFAGNAMRGVLEGAQEFGRLTIVRGSVGVSLIIGPAIMVLFQPHIVAVMWVLVIVRSLGAAAYTWFVWKRVSTSWECSCFAARRLLGLGGWMSVSSIVTMVLLYGDRVVIGARLSLEAVTWYTAPLEIILRLAVVPAAIMGVMFPAFSQLLVARRSDAQKAFERTRWAILAILAPPVLILIAAARPLLELWLGPEAAANSAPVATILAAGILAHSLAQPSFNLLQAAGRPDLPARFHLIEGPTYLAYLVILTDRFGIVGSAVAWTVRVTLSMVVLGWMARRVVLDRAPEAPAPGAVG